MYTSAPFQRDAAATVGTGRLQHCVEVPLAAVQRGATAPVGSARRVTWRNQVAPVGEGLALFTPSDVSHRHAPEIAARRQRALDAAYDAPPSWNSRPDCLEFADTYRQ